MYDFSPPPQPVYYCLVAHYTPRFGSIIKIPPDAGARTESYQDLLCSEQDKALIGEIVMFLGNNNKLSVMIRQDYLKSLGAQINHVHPLKFLSTIFTNPQLRGCMDEIFNDYFKRNGFMDGLGPSLTREADKGQIEPFLSDFAADINVPLEGMRRYFQIRDWERLVWFLIGKQTNG